MSTFLVRNQHTVANMNVFIFSGKLPGLTIIYITSITLMIIDNISRPSLRTSLFFVFFIKINFVLKYHIFEVKSICYFMRFFMFLYSLSELQLTWPWMVATFLWFLSIITVYGVEPIPRLKDSLLSISL